MSYLYDDLFLVSPPLPSFYLPSPKPRYSLIISLPSCACRDSACSHSHGHKWYKRILLKGEQIKNENFTCYLFTCNL